MLYATPPTATDPAAHPPRGRAWPVLGTVLALLALAGSADAREVMRAQLAEAWFKRICIETLDSFAEAPARLQALGLRRVEGDPLLAPFWGAAGIPVGPTYAHPDLPLTFAITPHPQGQRSCAMAFWAKGDDSAVHRAVSRIARPSRGYRSGDVQYVGNYSYDGGHPVFLSGIDRDRFNVARYKVEIVVNRRRGAP